MPKENRLSFGQNKLLYLLWLSMFVYTVTVLYITVLSRELATDYRTELEVFKSLKDLLTVHYDSHGQFILKELLLNICLFMPLGLMGGLLLKKYRIKNAGLKVLLLGCLFSLTIESLQLITKTGTFQTDDIIHNTIGCGIGYLILVICKKTYQAFTHEN